MESYTYQTRTARASPRPRSLADPPRLYCATKRGLDIVLSVVGLLVVGLPLLACAGWIRLIDGGPVFYWQWRAGRDGMLFRIYKLRTMRLDAEEHGGVQFARSGDPRILPGCVWMRRSHMDEGRSLATSCGAT
jgi:lipopolysaccharide/colanic/teichoic acid biosynthesis glycosyltransferase